MFHKTSLINNRKISIIFPIFFLYFLTGCTALDIGKPHFQDYIGYKDNPLSKEETLWLKDGLQSKITPKIWQASARINGRNRRELLYDAVDYIQYHFQYDNWYLDKAFTRTADDIFNAGVMGGCSDYALAHIALFRALGIPARLILTINMDWISAYKNNDLLIPNGHVFMEVYLEKDWHLIDPTYSLLYQGYDPELKSFPRKEYFVIRARDYWDVDITNLSDVIRIFQRLALKLEPGQYSVPHYLETEVKIYPF